MRTANLPFETDDVVELLGDLIANSDLKTGEGASACRCDRAVQRRFSES